MICLRLSIFSLSLLISFASYCADTLRLELHHTAAEFDLTKDHINYLDSNTKAYQNFDLVSFDISASCDDVGSIEYNRVLAQKRAKAVADWIKTKFSKQNYQENIAAIGELALVGEDTLAERAENRSVDIILVFDQRKITLNNIQVGEKLVLENLLFVGGYPTLLKESFSTLDSLVEILLKRSDLYFKIIGHVCCWPHPGDGFNNQSQKYDLSLMRAKAVYLYLVEKGISEDRMSYIGMGGTEPLGKGAKYDRRVEIEIVEKGKR